ncbi:MAG: FAD-dependent oxidoreductase [Planctomycetota bacterium]
MSGDGRMRVGVIGAGVAGLAAAGALVERGHEVVVFDKGRGPGGRISSRRAEPFVFDHGAQYFTARDPVFRRRVDELCAEGVVARWEGRLVTLGDSEPRAVLGPTERFVGTPRMSALARRLARGLDVRTGQRVAAAQRRAGRWVLTFENGAEAGELDRLLVTAPPAQAAALIGDRSSLSARAAEIVLRPCWAVMLGLSEPLAVPFDGAFCERSSLSWIARNSSKPGRPPGEAWVLHGAPHWTEEHLADGAEEVAAALVAELSRLTGVGVPEPAYRAAHRWRYALPDPGLEEGCLFDEAAGLALAGDGYVGGRVEGAYLSGLAAAARLG